MTTAMLVASRRRALRTRNGRGPTPTHLVVGLALAFAAGCEASPQPKTADDEATGAPTSAPVAEPAKPVEAPPSYDCLPPPGETGEVTTSKKDAINALLDEEWVDVYLDPRVHGASLPDYLAKLPYLMLQIGRDMPVPIEDLRIEESSLSGRFSFHQTPFAVKVPYRAVFAVVGDKTRRGLYWVADAPKDAFCGAQPPAAPPAAAEQPAATR